MDPMTRSEIFMAAAAGEYDGELPTPVTRSEQWLKKMADRVNTGPGADGGNDFVIRYATTDHAETPIVCDRTLAAIQAAYEAGKNLVVYFDDEYNGTSRCFWHKPGYDRSQHFCLESFAVYTAGGAIYMWTHKTSDGQEVIDLFQSYDLNLVRSDDPDLPGIVAYTIEEDGTVTDDFSLYDFILMSGDPDEKALMARVKDQRTENGDWTGNQTWNCVQYYETYADDVTECHLRFSATVLNGDGDVVAAFITHVFTFDGETAETTSVTLEEKILTASSAS